MSKHQNESILSGANELHRVTNVEPLPDLKLRVAFDDGEVGIVDITAIVKFSGVFEPLRDPAFFRQVSIHPRAHVVTWPNGADLDTETLYELVVSQPVGA